MRPFSLLSRGLILSLLALFAIACASGNHAHHGTPQQAQPLQKDDPSFEELILRGLASPVSFIVTPIQPGEESREGKTFLTVPLGQPQVPLEGNTRVLEGFDVWTTSADARPRELPLVVSSDDRTMNERPHPPIGPFLNAGTMGDALRTLALVRALPRGASGRAFRPDPIVTIGGLPPPTDDLVPQQCALDPMNAVKAWDRLAAAPRCPRVVVIDTGVYRHDDLRTISPDRDFHGHGTHVAGLIGAKANNTIGVVGICWDAEIYAVAALDNEGRGLISNIANAINNLPATEKLVLLAWGTTIDSSLLYEALRLKPGTLFVAAAGNSHRNLKDQPVYPAYYSKQLPNVISVMSTNCDGGVSQFSNYGDGVDIAAPGDGLGGSQRIQSTVLNHHYGAQAGTSMAAAHVAGAAALVLSQKPALTAAQLKQHLIASVKALPENKGSCWCGPRNGNGDCTCGVIDLDKAVYP